MRESTTFDAGSISALRIAMNPSSDVAEPGNGWRYIPGAAHRVAAAPELRLDYRYTLQTYQEYSWGNAGAVTWAVPRWRRRVPDHALLALTIETGLLRRHDLGPRPLGAIEPMRAIRGTGSPRAYLTASILAQELAEHGCQWHGGWWRHRDVLDAAPWDKPTAHNDNPGPRRSWRIDGELPKDWRPTVWSTSGRVTVEFWTFSALGSQTIEHHTDQYLDGTYAPVTTTTQVALGQRGYIN